MFPLLSLLFPHNLKWPAPMHGGWISYPFPPAVDWRPCHANQALAVEVGLPALTHSDKRLARRTGTGTRHLQRSGSSPTGATDYNKPPRLSNSTYCGCLALAHISSCFTLSTKPPGIYHFDK